MIPIDLFIGTLLLAISVFGLLLYKIQTQREQINDLCEALVALMGSSAALVASSEEMFEARKRAPYCTCDVCQLLETDKSDDPGQNDYI